MGDTKRYVFIQNKCWYWQIRTILLMRKYSFLSSSHHWCLKIRHCTVDVDMGIKRTLVTENLKIWRHLGKESEISGSKSQNQMSLEWKIKRTKKSWATYWEKQNNDNGLSTRSKPQGNHISKFVQCARAGNCFARAMLPNSHWKNQ